MSELKKKCKVVMLSTKQATRFGKFLDTNKLVSNISNNDIPRGEFQHLYIISDDEIKKGDLVIVNNKHIRQCVEDKVEKFITVRFANRVFKEVCQKIIATTDSSLFVEFRKIELQFPYKIYLPTVSDSFIQAYIKAYNEENLIADVIVEYESKCITGNQRIGYYDASRFVETPKLRGNEIIITKINDKNPKNLEIGKTYWFKYLPCKMGWQKGVITRFTEQGFAWVEYVDKLGNGALFQELYDIMSIEPKDIKTSWTKDEVLDLLTYTRADRRLSLEQAKSRSDWSYERNRMAEELKEYI